ncbi:MAG: ATP-binding protein [Steroidobacteraceae bacterium]
MSKHAETAMADSSKKIIGDGAARIVLIYAFIGIVYILVSDRLVSWLFADVQTVTLIGTLKGWAFIVITAGLLWFLIRRHSARLLASEAKRLEHEVLLSTVLDNVDGYLYIKDASYRYQYGNAAVCKEAGLTAEQFIGSEDTRFFDAETAAKLRANDRRVIEEGERLEAEEEHIHLQTGDRRTYLSVKIPLHRVDGSIYGLCGISTDITERKAAESESARLHAKLVQAQKMEAIGQLTGGIAHDFNNILASVMGYAALASRQAQDGGDAELVDYLRQIQRAGERAALLVSKMLQFSRAQPAEGELPSLHLQPVVAEIIKMLRPTIPSSIAIHMDFAETALIVKIELVELQQLITNLIINARDAIEGAGSITVTVKRRHLHERTACTACNAAISGDYIELAVINTGRGIVAQSLDEVFEPFYTTKEVGKGTGLGLSVVHGIVHKLAGHILVDTQPGQGTTITLLFPSISGRRAQDIVAAPTALPAQLPRSVTIMLIDDEPQLVRLMSIMLERIGCRVVAFDDSRAALSAFLAAPDDVDLVITDQTMPGLTGIELTRRMLAQRGDLPVLLCSGYSDQLDTAMSAGVRRVLGKPVSMPELSSIITQELGLDRGDTGRVNSETTRN